MEIKDKDHLHLSLLHKNKRGCYESFEPQVRKPLDELIEFNYRFFRFALSIRFPPLEVDDTANEAIDGILREDHVVTIPSNQKPLTKFLNIFPLSVQELIRDRVLREFEFFNPDCKLNFGQE